MKNTKMSLSEFRMKINTALLKKIGAGEEAITITSHGFPVARVGAINPAWDGRPFIDPDARTAMEDAWTKWLAVQGYPARSQTDTIIWTEADVTQPTTNTAPAVATFSRDLDMPPTTSTYTDPCGASVKVFDEVSDLDTPSRSVSIEEAVARQETPPGYIKDAEDASDLKAAQEVEHEDTVSSEQAKKELGLDEDAADIKTAREALAEPGRRPWNEVREELGLDEDVVPEYPRPVDCTLEQLEKQYGGTAVVKDRAEFLYFISKKRTLTATETEIYRQLMVQLRPPPSDDGI